MKLSVANRWVRLTLLIVAGGLLPGLALAASDPPSLQPQVQGLPPRTPPWTWMGPMGWRGADQRFIVMMIPHHEGAIAMARLALSRARHPEIGALAAQIIASQSQEIVRMRRWYRQWYGTEVPAWSGIGVGHGMGMGLGMVSRATSLEALRTAGDFDRAFLEQMVAHHRMGVMMAAHAQWHGERRPLRDLEVVMVRAQSREIEQMEQWYRQWYGAPLP